MNSKNLFSSILSKKTNIKQLKVDTINLYFAEILIYHQYTRLLILVIFSVYTVAYLFQPKNSFYSYALVCSSCWRIHSAKVVNSHIINTGGGEPVAKSVVTNAKDCVCGNSHLYPASRWRIWISYFVHLFKFSENHPIFSHLVLIVFLGEMTFSYWTFLLFLFQACFNKGVKKLIVTAYYKIKGMSLAKERDLFQSLYGIALSDIHKMLTRFQSEHISHAKAETFLRSEGYMPSKRDISNLLSKMETERILQRDPQQGNARKLDQNIDIDEATSLLGTRLDHSNDPKEKSFHIYRDGKPSSRKEYDRVEFNIIPLSKHSTIKNQEPLD